MSARDWATNWGTSGRGKENELPGTREGVGVNGDFSPKPIRVGDNERTRAINALGKHFSAGRLYMDEYDERVQVATMARTTQELAALFEDLPELDPSEDSSHLAAGASGHSRAGISGISGAGAGYEVAHGEHMQPLPPASYGRNIRLGLFLLSLLLMGTLAVHYENALFLVGAAVTAILLYVLKVGPESWHTTSRLRVARSMERDRIRIEARRLRLQEKQRKLEKRAQRSELSAQATSFAHNALGVANDALAKRRQR